MRFLFRYRDLIADTLSEHRSILTTRGWCWWGWWKRPNEPSRLDLWQEIERSTEHGTRVQIGLFHSGTGQVHPAMVDRVILPVEDEFGQCIPILPPDEELDAVPTYYRASRYSRGWIRLTSIAEMPTSFFGEFSYAAAPPLPYYSQRLLTRK